MKIHVALVSDQILANLIPALMERPDKVILVCTAGMAEKGLDRRLSALLKREEIATEFMRNAPDVGVKQIQDYALELLGQVEQQHPGAEVVFNATGGTKLMSLGFVEVFRGVANRILYTDTAHRRIEYLPDAQGRVPNAASMTDVLDVPKYLAAQGCRFASAVSDDSAWRERAASRKEACKHLGRNAAQLQEFIGLMNGLADDALEKIPGTEEERLVAPCQPLRSVPWGDWAKALAGLARARLIDWREGEAEVVFTDVETARFLRGGWLEEYAWHAVKNGSPFDTRMGVQGVWEGGGSMRNEFDVLATHRNQLLFIECKTLRFRDGNDNDLAYKVDSLGQDTRGLFGETWLLSARKPSEVLSDRARQARIRLLGPEELPRLRDAVRQWMAG